MSSFADFSSVYGFGGGNSRFGQSLTPIAPPMSLAPPMGASNPMAAATAALSGSGSATLTPTIGAGVAGVTPATGGFGFNLPTLNLALGGIQTLGGLWNAWEQRKMAQDTFNFQKTMANTNLKNQIQSYNTTLEDRSRSRAHTEGQAPEVAQAYIDKNRLSR